MKKESKSIHIAVPHSGYWVLDLGVRWVFWRLNDPENGNYCVLFLRWQANGLWGGGYPDIERVPDIIASYVPSLQAVRVSSPSQVHTLDIPATAEQWVFMAEVKKFLDVIGLGIPAKQD